MRPVLSLVLAASTILALDSPIDASHQLVPADLSHIVTHPESHLGTLVQFRCVFAEVSDLHDVHATFFRPERYLNLVVWQDRARLFDPVTRGDPVTTLYLDRDRFRTEAFAAITKYRQIVVVGKVRNIIDGEPHIEVVSVAPVRDRLGRPVSSAFSDTSVYRLQQAVALSASGARDLAEDQFAAAMAEDLPVWARGDVGLLRGRNLAAAGRFAEVVPVMEAVIANAPQDSGLPPGELAQAHALLAKAHGELSEAGSGDRSAAITHARAALTLDPSLGEAYAVLGIGLAGQGQFDEARRACDQAIRLRPADAEVRWYLGRILDQQGNYDAAIDALKKAIDLTPKDHRIHMAIAAAYRHRGLAAGANGGTDLGTALREYDISLRLDAGAAEAHLGAGQVIEDAARIGSEIQVGVSRVPAAPALALERYAAAVAIRPGLTAAWQARIRLLLALERAGDARAVAQTWVEAAPEAQRSEATAALDGLSASASAAVVVP